MNFKLTAKRINQNLQKKCCLADDGTTLISVSSEDLENGTLTIPEGITIGEEAFADCTGLTEVTIAEGVTIDRYEFFTCTSFNNIVVNTKKEEKIARIKTSLPDNLKDCVIQKSVWDDVLRVQ